MATLETLAARSRSESFQDRSPDRNIPIGYLRWFVIVLVVLLHAIGAYNPIAPKPGAPLTQLPHLWLAFPVVDSERSAGLGMVAAFSDLFLMALMFFISGLFLAESLERKGAFRFAWDRIKRLGLPFVVAVAVVAPLAYWPAYLQSGHFELSYWQTWLSLPFWPPGPAWFLSLLLAFGLVAAVLQLFLRRWVDGLSRLARHADTRMWKFCLGLVLASAAGYLALVIVFEPFRWFFWGPFGVQTSRVLHYAVYFFAGVAVGACGIDKGLLATDGRLARRWWLLPIWAGLVFSVLTTIVMAAFGAKGQQALALWTAAGVLVPVSCALSSFTLLAFFVRFVRRRNAVFDSLERNAYGIYLVHYAFVSWVQYALLGSHVGAVPKGLIAFGSALVLSWILAAALRRSSRIAGII